MSFSFSFLTGGFLWDGWYPSIHFGQALPSPVPCWLASIYVEIVSALYAVHFRHAHTCGGGTFSRYLCGQDPSPWLSHVMHWRWRRVKRGEADTSSSSQILSSRSVSISIITRRQHLWLWSVFRHFLNPWQDVHCQTVRSSSILHIRRFCADFKTMLGPAEVLTAYLCCGPLLIAAARIQQLHDRPIIGKTWTVSYLSSNKRLHGANRIIIAVM